MNTFLVALFLCLCTHIGYSQSAEPTPKYAKLTYISRCGTTNYQNNAYYRIDKCFPYSTGRYLLATQSGQQVSINLYSDSQCANKAADFASYTIARNCHYDAPSNRPFIGDVITGYSNFPIGSQLGAYYYPSCSSQASGAWADMFIIYFPNVCLANSQQSFFKKSGSFAGGTSVKYNTCYAGVSFHAEIHSDSICDSPSAIVHSSPVNTCEDNGASYRVGGLYVTCGSLPALPTLAPTPTPIPTLEPPPQYAKITYLRTCNSFDYVNTAFFRMWKCFRYDDQYYMYASQQGQDVTINLFSDSECKDIYGAQRYNYYRININCYRESSTNRPYIGDVITGYSNFPTEGKMGAYYYPSCASVAGGWADRFYLYWTTNCIMDSKVTFFDRQGQYNNSDSVAYTTCTPHGTYSVNTWDNYICSGTPTPASGPTDTCVDNGANFPYGGLHVTCGSAPKPPTIAPTPPPPTIQPTPPPVNAYVLIRTLPSCSSAAITSHSYYILNFCFKYSEDYYMKSVKANGNLTMTLYTDSQCTNAAQGLLNMKLNTCELIGGKATRVLEAFGISILNPPANMLSATYYSSCTVGGAPLMAKYYVPNACNDNKDTLFFTGLVMQGFKASCNAQNYTLITYNPGAACSGNPSTSVQPVNICQDFTYWSEGGVQLSCGPVVAPTPAPTPAPTLPPAQPCAPAKSYGYAEFTGQAPLRFSVRYPAALNFSSQELTIETWFKTKHTSDQMLFRWRYFGYGLVISGAGQLHGLYCDSSYTSCPHTTSPNSNYNDGEWHHVAYTYSRTSQQTTLIVDGQLVATQAAPTPIDLGGICDSRCGISPEPDRAVIGGDGSAGTNFVGSLLNFRAWRTALSAATIDELMNTSISASETANYPYLTLNIPLNVVDAGTTDHFTDLLPQNNYAFPNTLNTNSGAVTLFSCSSPTPAPTLSPTVSPTLPPTPPPTLPPTPQPTVPPTCGSHVTVTQSRNGRAFSISAVSTVPVYSIWFHLPGASTYMTSSWGFKSEGNDLFSMQNWRFDQGLALPAGVVIGGPGASAYFTTINIDLVPTVYEPQTNCTPPPGRSCTFSGSLVPGASYNSSTEAGVQYILQGTNVGNWPVNTVDFRITLSEPTSIVANTFNLNNASPVTNQVFTGTAPLWNLQAGAYGGATGFTVLTPLPNVGRATVEILSSICM